MGRLSIIETNWTARPLTFTVSYITTSNSLLIGETVSLPLMAVLNRSTQQCRERKLRYYSRPIEISWAAHIDYTIAKVLHSKASAQLEQQNKTKQIQFTCLDYTTLSTLI